MNSRLPLVIVSVACLLLVSHPASAKAKWLYGRTAHYEIFSNGNPKEVKKVIVELEKFRAGFTTLFQLSPAQSKPVLVYVFKTDHSFKKYKPLDEKGKPKPSSGWFLENPDQSIIALHLEGDLSYTKEVIYHEYIHFLLSISPDEIPAWYNEGVAELYSTFSVEGNEVEFGKTKPYRVYSLLNEDLIPMEELFAVDKNSPYYNERNKMSIFYAQSWAFLHYCMFSEDQAYSKAIPEFVEKFKSGNDTEAIFQDVFQIYYEEMEERIKRHIRRGKYYLNSVTFKKLDVDLNLNLEKASDAQINFFQGHILIHTNRHGDALPYLRKTTELAPNWARPYENLGLVALQKLDLSLAENSFWEAEKRKSSNALVYYHLASFKLGSLYGGKPISPDQFDASKTYVYQKLTTAIRINPYYLPSYTLLADTLLRTNKKVSEFSLDFLEPGLIIDPHDTTLAFKLARLAIRSDYPERARKILEPYFSEDTEDSFREQAEKLWLETGAELP